MCFYLPTENGARKLKTAMKEYDLRKAPNIDKYLARSKDGNTRGKNRSKLTYEALLHYLSEESNGWYIEKIQRFFNRKPGRYLHKTEVKQICDFLGVELNESDYDIKEKLMFKNSGQSPEDNRLNRRESQNKVFLILRIEESKENNSEQKKLNITAWLDNGIDKPYIISQESCYSLSGSVPDLGKEIDKCLSTMGDYDELELEIEIFTQKSLLTECFEHWPYTICEPEREFSVTVQICQRYLVYVRSLHRWYLTNKLKSLPNWQTKWSNLNSQTLPLPSASNLDEYNNTLDGYAPLPTTTWINSCGNISSRLDEFILHGIPLVLWSRHSNFAKQHWQEINDLVHQKTLTQLLQDIKTRRIEALADTAPDSTHLGRHLVLMLENPDRPPPWINARIRS